MACNASLRKVWLTTVETADYLRLSARTLEGFRVSGWGPKYFKVGPGKQAKVVYCLEDVNAWMEQFRRGSTSER